MTRECLAMALDYHECGLAPLALPYGVKWDKRHWRQYQERGPARAETIAMFEGAEKNVALMEGRPSGNLFTKECDTRQSYEDTLYQFAALGIRTWAVQRDPNGSPHDGGGHFHLRAPVAVASNDYKEHGYQIKGQDSYVLVPYSLHPGGTIYRTALGNPREIFTLPSLDAIPGLKLHPARPAATISRLAWRILNADPATLARYHTRSEATAALAVSLVNTGNSFDTLLRLLSKYPGPGKYAELRDEDPDNALRWLHLTWYNAVAWANTHTSPARQLAGALWAWANDRPWPGRTGATDRAVYLAHLAIVHRCGKNPYAAACRELGELAGVGHITAAKATANRLIPSLLDLVQKSTAALPARYFLKTPEGLSVGQKCTYPHMGVIESVHFCPQSAHDAFRRGHKDVPGLGKRAAGMWAALQERGRMGDAELAEVVGCGLRTVRRRLADMAAAGLVSQFEGGEWMACDDADLDAAAVAYGTAGAGERQRERHAEQRARQRRWLQEDRR